MGLWGWGAAVRSLVGSGFLEKVLEALRGPAEGWGLFCSRTKRRAGTPVSEGRFAPAAPGVGGWGQQLGLEVPLLTEQRSHKQRGSQDTL